MNPIPNFITVGSGQAMLNVIQRLDRQRFAPSTCVLRKGGCLKAEVERLGQSARQIVEKNTPALRPGLSAAPPGGWQRLAGAAMASPGLRSSPASADWKGFPTFSWQMPGWQFYLLGETPPSSALAPLEGLVRQQAGLAVTARRTNTSTWGAGQAHHSRQPAGLPSLCAGIQAGWGARVSASAGLD